MKNKYVFPLIFLFIISLSLPMFGQGVVIKKDIHVAENEVLDNVISLGGEVLIQGKVEESVVAFGGTITIEGEVGEVVLGIGTKITLKSTAKIEGDVVSLGGTLDKEPGSRVDGDTVYMEIESLKDVLAFLGGFGFAGLIPILIIIKLITLFIWFILAVILAALFPRQLSLASSQIRKSFWPVFGTGFLTIIIFTGLVIFSVLLSFILIGIPILLALIIIGVVIKIFGRVVLFYFFGESLARAFGNKQPTAFLAVFLGLILVGLISFIPILGSLFAFILSIIGWGVVIRTKFGTTENWFRRTQ